MSTQQSLKIFGLVLFVVVGLSNARAENEALPKGAIARYTVSDKPNMTDVLFLGDGRRLAASDLDHVVVWDLVSGKTLADLGGAEIKAASPDGNVVVSRSGHYMQLLNVGANPPTRIPSDPSDAEGAAFSPSGALATTTLTCDVIFWKPADQWTVAQKTKLQTNRGNGTEGIAFSPDGKMLAVQIAGNFSLLDPATGNKLYEEPDSKLFGHFSFSPDGATLAIADPPYTDKPMIHLWDVATKKLRGSCPIEFGVHHLSYFPDGSAVVYRGGTLNGIQGGIRICDIETGALYASLDIDDSKFASVAVSPDGRTLAAGNDKSVIFLWDIGQLILKNEKIPNEFKPADLDALWQAMGGKDSAAGYRAAWKMGASGNAGVRFLKTRLKLTPKNQPRIDKLIEALDNENAGIRTAARNDLTALGDQVEPALRKVAEGPPTPHARSEAKGMLALMEMIKAPVKEKTPEEAQQSRAILALELIATPEAIDLLNSLATSAATRRQCWEARRGSERVAKTVKILSPSSGDSAASAAEEKPNPNADIAARIAINGADLASRGKLDAARSLLFRALFEDEHCSLALFELGKIYQSQGDPNAIIFLTRAAAEFAKKGNFADSPQKLADAKARLNSLNTYPAQYSGLLEAYAEDLVRVSKKAADAFTTGEILRREAVLELSNTAAAAKLPTAPVAVARPTVRPGVDEPAAAGVDSVPADIEQSLKAAGWTTIKGQWKKVANNTYEVSEGKLECAKVNGLIQLWVHKGGTGSVTAFVRNDQKEFPWGFFGKYKHEQFAKGYGITVKGDECAVYLPLNGTMAGWTGPEVYPYRDHAAVLTDQPKHLFLISVQDSTLEVSIDNKSDRKTSYKISKDGPFTIEIKGTMTIEDPKTAGQ